MKCLQKLLELVDTAERTARVTSHATMVAAAHRTEAAAYRNAYDIVRLDHEQMELKVSDALLKVEKLTAEMKELKSSNAVVRAVEILAHNIPSRGKSSLTPHEIRSWLYAYAENISELAKGGGGK